MCGKRRAFLSLQVGNDGEHYEPALDSDGANIPSSWWIGPAYHAGGECFDRLAEVVRREAFSAHCGRVASDWSAGCMFSRVTTRGSRDRLKGQPQERQLSAAEGGTRDRLPRRAAQERLHDSLVSICICDIVSMLCMSIHGVRMFTEPVFYRGRHGQESEEGKEDREGSHQEGGKEDIKEKEIVVLRDCRLRVATRTQAKPLQKI